MVHIQTRKLTVQTYWPIWRLLQKYIFVNWNKPATFPTIYLWEYQQNINWWLRAKRVHSGWSMVQLKRHADLSHEHGRHLCKLSFASETRQGSSFCGSDIALYLTGVMGWEVRGGPPDTIKKQSSATSFLQSFPYRSNIQPCLCLLRRGWKSTNTEAIHSLWVVF